LDVVVGLISAELVVDVPEEVVSEVNVDSSIEVLFDVTLGIVVVSSVVLI